MGDMDWWQAGGEERSRRLALDLFQNPEIAGNETASSALLRQFLQEEGFQVTCGTGALSTAFTATWGQGKPVIGFLAEYDALPELGQEAVPFRKALPGNGHGCGHNLLGAGCAAAAAALKAEMERRSLSGTVILFGCPSEETCQGKGLMAQAGYFDNVDVAISWHPSDKNQVSEESFQAMVSRRFHFYGQSAHAAASPEKGRSALDAAELMNIAVNYLREHVPDHVRMHYVYTSAGEKPNIVPDYAELWYFVRAKDQKTAEDADRRVILCAQGAAMATETRVESEVLAASPETRINHTLNLVMNEVLTALGTPDFSQEEIAFAAELRKSLGMMADLQPVRKDMVPLSGQTRHVAGSTDVSVVSQMVPTVTLNVACQARDIPGHHWGVTACAGSQLGLRGMVHAARVMTGFGLRVMEKPEIAEKAWEEFRLKK